MLKVSVVMAFHNPGEYLRHSIDSILKQNFNNFEIVLVDDGSTDGSDRLMHHLDKSRLKLIKNVHNKGLAYSLNSGIAIAEGEYIVRMDADDIALPNRLMVLSNFLDDHPEIDVCGSARWINNIGGILANNKPGKISRYSFLTGNQLAHPTVIIRSNLFKEKKFIYDEKYKSSQDYDLWSRMLDHVNFYNLEVPLLIYREHENQISAKKRLRQEINTFKIKSRLMKKFIFDLKCPLRYKLSYFLSINLIVKIMIKKIFL
jgi:glycosyltransferase involved in cell wall biosynthesis